jgi:hypothetical protein
MPGTLISFWLVYKHLGPAHQHPRQGPKLMVRRWRKRSELAKLLSHFQMWTECGLHKKTRNALCYELLTWARPTELPRERFGKHLHHQSPISMALKPAGRPLWAKPYVHYPAIVNLVSKPVEVYGLIGRWALEFRVRIEVFGGMKTHFSISFHPWWFAMSIVIVN